MLGSTYIVSATFLPSCDKLPEAKVMTELAVTLERSTGRSWKVIDISAIDMSLYQLSPGWFFWHREWTCHSHSWCLEAGKANGLFQIRFSAFRQAHLWRYSRCRAALECAIFKRSAFLSHYFILGGRWSCWRRYVLVPPSLCQIMCLLRTVPFSKWGGSRIILTYISGRFR